MPAKQEGREAVSRHNRVRRELRRVIRAGAKCAECNQAATHIKGERVLCAGHAAPVLNRRRAK